ncbi:AAA family ATPase [Desulfotomaculum copahuensis]|uniref:AAA+ ATPase domain-containing protein n=1 Tax=Desulfotomaculum copahuensis TaxID=1838280 RepID=A0A1B7LIC9_9FIRM|nr:AAA family ATPase [Desulfotomaculum copahuensis]OAT86141.1 hypothetical protein A6M21_04305 [Desulfotomaculum copahuensis]
MYLEEVIISGFKSYAVEAGVGFKPGIGVIVGNNGVGKSNILDAVAWALGENDPDRLRCDREEDLFFGGTQEYPPAATVNVTLKLKAGPEKKASVTTLARRKERCGADVYTVDGVELGRSAYLQKLSALGWRDTARTLIRQEQINRFLHLSPEERVVYLAGLLNGTEVNQELISRLNASFKNYLQTLIPGSDGNILLTGRDGAPGLLIEASLGKGMKNSTLLSGGEKTICSLALNLALFEQLNSPLYLLDEVEPSLDWTNHRNMQALLKSLNQKKQLIMITHLRSTIQLADSLHGIRARKDGSSFVKFYFEMNERLLRAYKCC